MVRFLAPLAISMALLTACGDSEANVPDDLTLDTLQTATSCDYLGDRADHYLDVMEASLRSGVKNDEWTNEEDEAIVAESLNYVNAAVQRMTFLDCEE